MAVTFRLDDVDRASDRRPTRTLAEALGEALALGGDPGLAVIDHGSTHPLLGAVHVAFAEHRPLVLSPDAVWLTIAQGVAQHVRRSAEVLRPRLVRHAGKKQLSIDVDGPMPADPAAWASVVAAFRGRLADELGEGRARLLECDFSTSTEVELVASQIALMDVYSAYFDFYIYCVCGIPEITLLGTPDDWRRIRQRIDVLAELDLEFWTRSLALITDEFVRAASGDPDITFWRRIYKPRDSYGSELITGWIARLYPYLRSAGTESYVNPLLGLPIDEPRDLGPDDGSWFWGPGITSRSVSTGPCVARVQVVDRVHDERRDLALHGGVLAVAQDSEGRLAPVCGWFLRSAPSIAMVVERIRAEHASTPAPPLDRDLEGRVQGPADFIGLYREIGEATLFAATRPWRIRPIAEHQQIEFSSPHDRTIDALRFLDLPDGTFVAHTSFGAGECLLRGRIDALEPGPPEQLSYPAQNCRSRQSLDEVEVIDGTLAAVLAAALDSGGSTELPSTKRMMEVLPEYMLESRDMFWARLRGAASEAEKVEKDMSDETGPS
ncbi:DUF4419 domain-containing protein [Nannocystis punicea]|uniref:DUF4419 domain-containing protein n=1 Tax=Nannocystis punicea TaxID=2995304 RepID=A0ABY7H9B0_9BACT|nr:DUF4419 domain-containing protein [Nannocystis poenicansa]WAS95675.1 DUF4419 domain-containing protein [Nannocystis poenicansa]